MESLAPGATAAVLAVGDDVEAAQELRRRFAEAGAVVLDGPQAAGETKVVILLDDLRPRGSRGDMVATATAALRIARQFLAGGSEDRVFVVVQAGGGALAGLARTARLEWPGTVVRLIDIERGSAHEMAHTVHRELAEGGDTPEVLLSSAGRQVWVDAAGPGSPVANRMLPDDPVLLVTGGARGVTAACAVALAQRMRCRLALVRRGGTPDVPVGLDALGTERELVAGLARRAQDAGEKATPAALTARARAILAAREAEATVRAIEAAGSRALLISADIADAGQAARAVEDVRRAWGRIDGIVHGAGLLADKLIAEKTDEQVRAVIDAKVTGLRHLLEATRRDPLRALILFSSIAGRYGNVGQADYAMANAELVAMAFDEARTRGAACLVRAIDWGAWDGGMVNEALRAAFQRQGVPLIDLQAGAQAFVDELVNGRADPDETHIALVPQAVASAAPGRPMHALPASR